MNILSWTLFGIIAGSFAHLIDNETAKGGLLGAILWGVSGSLVGGLIANIIFGNYRTFDISSFIIAICGSLLLLFVHRSVFTNTIDNR